MEIEGKNSFNAVNSGRKIGVKNFISNNNVERFLGKNDSFLGKSLNQIKNK
jgi:hypothetical protein